MVGLNAKASPMLGLFPVAMRFDGHRASFQKPSRSKQDATKRHRMPRASHYGPASEKASTPGVALVLLEIVVPLEAENPGHPADFVTRLASGECEPAFGSPSVAQANRCVPLLAESRAANAWGDVFCEIPGSSFSVPNRHQPHDIRIE
jgi:hypothetical protein